MFTLSVLKYLMKRLGFEMTVSQIMDARCVMVNDGSGVLVNAMSQEYSYVLTAAHVLRNENEIKNRRGQALRIIEINRHPDSMNFDCAVIQVEYIPNIEQFTQPTRSLEHRANLVFTGFPMTERQSATPLKHYDGHMTSVVDELIMFTIDGIPGRDSIVGMSGGGVYHVRSNRPYLIGVECRMDGEQRNQQFGRVQCQGLARFEEIIQARGLAHMVPSFLECFSCLKDQIFNFNVIEPTNVARLQNALLDVADSLVERGMPAPYELMNKYKNALLISSDKPEEVRDKALWIAYFEFLIICVLIDGVDAASSTYIQGLERKRKIIYSSDSGNWIGRLQEILSIARKTLDEKGTIIVVSPEGGAEMFPPEVYVDRIIKNISTVPKSGPFIKIDSPESAIYKSFVITHLNGLRKACVVLKENDFSAISGVSELLTLFRDSFNEIIK